MDSVMLFNSELAALYECKPPISKAKMTAITKAAIKAIKFYKHVVQSVEKFIQKCKTEYKIPGLYVIDSIVRQSRHQFGIDNDLFAARFGKNILVTFYYLFQCPPEDKSRVIRVLNLWQKNNVFEEGVVQPIFDLSDSNHPTYIEVSNQIHQKAARVRQQPSTQQVMHTTPQQQQNHTPQHQHTPQTPQTPQPSHSIASMPTPTSVNNSIVSSMPNQVNNTVVTGLDPNLIQQIQQILMKTEEGVAASSVAVLSGLSNQPTNFLHSQPPPMQLPIHQPPVQVPIHQPLGQVPIHQPPPGIVPALNVPVQETAPVMSGMSSSGDFDERTLPFVDTSLPPPGYLQNFSHNQTPHVPHPMAATTIMSQKPPSPKEEGEHSGESDEDKENHQDDVIQIDDRSRSPSYSRGARRPRKRSRSRSRSRSRHHRSRSRGRRSRSRDRDRRYRDRDRNRSRRDIDKDQEREKEKDRKKKGLPSVKPDHISVCSTTLWVGHLSKLVHQEELSDTFGEYGDIVSINLIPPRGCAFICMNRRQDAARALLKLRNYKMLNKAITIAWAPGKGVKGKEFKDDWEVDAGCSYVPYSKLTSMDTADLDALEEGGMIDEDTVPSWVKGKLSARMEVSNTEAVMKPAPSMGQHMAIMPVGGTPLGIVPKDLVPPTIPPPFTLPNIPPPRIQPGSMPPIGPPLMPMIGVPPPMGMPPMPQNLLAPTIISTVPPHLSMAAIPHHLRPPMPVAHVMLDQSLSNASQDSDSMDVEMEDMQRPEIITVPPPNEGANSNSENSSHKHRFPPGNAHMPTDEDGARLQNSPHSQPPPPFSIRPPPSADHPGIRFGIIPRGPPGFVPRGLGVGGFLGPPPPMVSVRPPLPGIVVDGPRPFRPLAGPSNPPMNGRFMSVSPIRNPPPERPSGRMEEEKGGWPAAGEDSDGERRKFRNRDTEPWSRDGGSGAPHPAPGGVNNGRRYENPADGGDGGRRGGGDRNERKFRSEPEPPPEEDAAADRKWSSRDRSRGGGGGGGARNSDDSNNYRGSGYDDREDRRQPPQQRDRGGRHRDRDRYDQDSSYGGRGRDGRDRYKDNRHDQQWAPPPGSGRERWGEGRPREGGWGGNDRNDRNDRKPWNDDRGGGGVWNNDRNDRWNREEPAEEVDTGWMNSEDYAFQQNSLREKPREPPRPPIEAESKSKGFSASGDSIATKIVPPPEKEAPSKARKDRDSSRISRWGRFTDDGIVSSESPTPTEAAAQGDKKKIDHVSTSSAPPTNEDSAVPSGSEPKKVPSSDTIERPIVEGTPSGLMNSADCASQRMSLLPTERKQPPLELESRTTSTNDAVTPDTYDPFEVDNYGSPKAAVEGGHTSGPSTPPPTASYSSSKDVLDNYGETGSAPNDNAYANPPIPSGNSDLISEALTTDVFGTDAAVGKCEVSAEVSTNAAADTHQYEVSAPTAVAEKPADTGVKVDEFIASAATGEKDHVGNCDQNQREMELCPQTTKPSHSPSAEVLTEPAVAQSESTDVPLEDCNRTADNLL